MDPQVTAIHESQISLSIWQGWLYKRFFLRPNLTLGIAELRIGRTAPELRRHSTDQVIYYVLDGCGQFISGGLRERFEVGKTISVSAQQSYEFNPDQPTRLLCVSAPATLPPQITPRLMLGDDRELFRPNTLSVRQTFSKCHFVVSGVCSVNIAGTLYEQSAGKAFYINPDVEYTLENRHSTAIRVINAYAGTAAREAEQPFNAT